MENRVVHFFSRRWLVRWPHFLSKLFVQISWNHETSYSGGRHCIPSFFLFLPPLSILFAIYWRKKWTNETTEIPWQGSSLCSYRPDQASCNLITQTKYEPQKMRLISYYPTMYKSKLILYIFDRWLTLFSSFCIYFWYSGNLVRHISWSCSWALAFPPFLSLSLPSSLIETWVWGRIYPRTGTNDFFLASTAA